MQHARCTPRTKVEMTVTPAEKAPIGYRADGTPIRLHTGAVDIQVDDGDDEPDTPTGRSPGPDDEDDDPDLPDPDDEPDDWTPPTRDQWERQQAAITRNNAENRRYRQLTALAKKRGIDDIPAWVDRIMGDANGQPAGVSPPVPPAADPPPGGQDPTDPPAPAAGQDIQEQIDRAVQRATERAEVQAELRYTPVLAKLAAKTALTDARWIGTDLGRVMKLIDLDAVTIGDDGEIEGIDEQVEEIKAEFPEWFKPKIAQVTRRRGAAAVDGGQRPPARRTPTWEDRMSEQLDRR